MGIQSMFPPSAVKPSSQYSVANNLGPFKTGFGPFSGADVALLRDNFSVSTWLLIGCALQGALTLVVRPSLAALPSFLLLTWYIIDILLISFGLKQNPQMKDVVSGKFSVAYPAEGDRTAIRGLPGDNGPGAVMILGTRCNSPLGIFAPGFKEVGDRFRGMTEQLEKEKESNGFMGMSIWLSAGERSSRSELTTFSYWRSVEDIHQFALSPIHRETWEWWNKSVAKYSHIGIMHEIFEIPKRNGWEGIYVNYHPSGLAATSRLVDSSEKATGKQEWVNPIVDARRGVYRSSRGRMAKGDLDGSSNENITMDPYAQV